MTKKRRQLKECVWKKISSNFPRTALTFKVTGYFWKNIKPFFKNLDFPKWNLMLIPNLERNKWVSRACFRDNQHLMEAYAGVFEVRIAPPEVIRTKINTHEIIVLCRLNKCTNDGKWTIVQHQTDVFDEKTNKYLYSSYFVLSVVSKTNTKSNKRADKKLCFHMFKKLAFLKKLICGRFLGAFSNKHVKGIWSRAKFEGFASLKFKTWWFLNKIFYFIQRFLCARSLWAQIERQ